MKLDFLAYSLNDTITSFKKELLYLNTTYYERNMVYEHLNKPKTILGFNVDKSELCFSYENLIAISIYLKEYKSFRNDLIEIIEILIDQKPTQIDLETFGNENENKIYSWEFDDKVLGVITKRDNGQLIIHSALSTQRFMW